MIVHLEGPIKAKMFTQLVEAFNNLKVGDNLAIYFSSTGGCTDTTEAIVDLINKNSDKIGITFYGEIFSAGMHILLKARCERHLLPDTRGMYHYSWQGIDITEGGRPSSGYDKFCMDEMKKSQKKTLEYLKTTPLSDKEIRDIKNGYDVYFPTDRLQQIIDGTK